MVELPAIAWIAIAGVGLATCLGILVSLAAMVRNEIFLHDLRLEVVSKRNAFLTDLLTEARDRADPSSARKIEEQAQETALKAEQALAEIAQAA